VRLPARIDVLRLRNFRNLFIGQAVSLVGDGLFPVALTFGVLDLRNSGIDVGIVLAAFAVPMVLFTLIGGVWADRLRREWVMIASDLIRFVTMAVIAALLLSHHAQVWSLALLGFVYGCGDAFFFPAYTALIQQIVPRDRLQEANALRGVADGFGWFVGPAVSGILVALIGAGGTLGLDAVTFLVSAAYLLTLRVPVLARTVAQTTFLAELRDGWREVSSRTWLWVMMLRAMLVLFVTIAPLQVLGPLAITARHQSPALWGFMVGLFSLGMLVGGVVALYYRPLRPMVTVTLCGTTAAAPMIALALRFSPADLLAVWFVRGIAIGVFSAIWDTTLQRHIAYESMARVSSWDWMTAGGLWPIGLVIAGPFAQAFGVTETLWFSAGCGVVFSVWVLFVKDVWRLRGPQEPDRSPESALPL
jgi:MFS family permease